MNNLKIMATLTNGRNTFTKVFNGLGLVSGYVRQYNLRIVKVKRIQ